MNGAGGDAEGVCVGLGKSKVIWGVWGVMGKVGVRGAFRTRVAVGGRREG